MAAPISLMASKMDIGSGTIPLSMSRTVRRPPSARGQRVGSGTATSRAGPSASTRAMNVSAGRYSRERTSV